MAQRSPKFNILNLIFRDNVQGQEHPGRCFVVEPELPNYRKSKCVVQNKKNGNKMSIKVSTM